MTHLSGRNYHTRDYFSHLYCKGTSNSHRESISGQSAGSGVPFSGKLIGQGLELFPIMKLLLPSVVSLVYALLIRTETRVRAASVRMARSLAVDEAEPVAGGDGSEVPTGEDLRPAEAAASCNMNFPRFSENQISPVWQVNEIDRDLFYFRWFLGHLILCWISTHASIGVLPGQRKFHDPRCHLSANRDQDRRHARDTDREVRQATGQGM